MNHLLAEFRRRNVFRVAALYAVVAWLVAQVADVVIGLGGFPPSIGRTVLIILALGFPVAVGVSWAFEWTPQGIRRESEAADPTIGTRPGGRRLDAMIIALLSVALVYFAATHDWSGAPPVASASIAVLPFENRSAQPDDLYFTDGIHEDILTRLGKISSMVVISRTSVMRYRDSGKTLPEIAAELGVATILEGGVQRAGNRVRINMQLIEASSDRHLWAETYDRELSADNVFAIQSEIASSIADALHARLLPGERQIIENVPTQNLEAYDAYLLGRRRLASRDVDDLERGRRHFLEAIELDPGFALAYAGLADTLMLLHFYSEATGDDLLREAESAASAALDLNPGLGEAHTSYGVVLSSRGRPPEAYVPYLQRGVELAPGSAEARRWLARYLGESGRDAEALEQLQKAVQLDPLSPIIRVALGSAYLKLGRQDDAVAQYERALAIDPRFLPARVSIQDVAGNDVSLVYASVAYRDKATDAWVLLQFVLGYLELGDDVRAQQWLAELDRVAPDSAPARIAHLNLNLFRSKPAEALTWASALVDIEAGVITVPSRTLMLDDLRRGDVQAALDRHRAKYPELFSDDPPVGDNLSAVTDVAMLLLASGDKARADRLLDRALDYIAEPANRTVLRYGLFEARIHALRGSPDEALESLRRAIDAGWKFHWWFYLKQDPVFDELRGDPRFQALAGEMESRMARQLTLVRQKESDGEIALPPGA